MLAVCVKKVTVFIVDVFFGAGLYIWDLKDAVWGMDDFNDVFVFVR